MTDVDTHQSPVPPARQNDFREQKVSERAEHESWRRSTSDITPPLAPRPSIDIPDDLLACVTVSALTGADLGATKALTAAARLLADDPTRRRAVLASFTGAAYIAPSPEFFEGFAARVASAGANAIPMPGMAAVGAAGAELFTTRALWIMFLGAAATTFYASAYVERASRLQP